MNSRNLENRRSSIAPPARDVRITRGVRAAQGTRAALCLRAALDVRDARVSLGARVSQVNLSAGTAETLEETS